MLAERSGHVAEHRIGVARYRHQVRGRGAECDVTRKRAQIPWSDPHVERRADVESHREAVKLPHDHVLETRSLELIGCGEHFGTDEPRDVVDDCPTRDTDIE